MSTSASSTSEPLLYLTAERCGSQHGEPLLTAFIADLRRSTSFAHHLLADLITDKKLGLKVLFHSLHVLKDEDDMAAVERGLGKNDGAASALTNYDASSNNWAALAGLDDGGADETQEQDEPEWERFNREKRDKEAQAQRQVKAAAAAASASSSSSSKDTPAAARLRVLADNGELPGLHLGILVMVRGNSDFILRKLGDKYGFPRGFPLVWRPLAPGAASGDGTSMPNLVSYGFYPKFDNDNAGGVPSALLATSTEGNSKGALDRLLFFRKWSGYLSMLLAVALKRSDVLAYAAALGPSGEYDRERRRAALRLLAGSASGSSEDSQIVGWTATTKNSADNSSSFVRDARRIWNDVLRNIQGASATGAETTKKLFAQMLANNVSVCAETMSWEDQCHGARVLKETPVVTAVASGCASTASSSSSSSAAPVDNKPTFVKYADVSEISAFCATFQLPCDAPVHVEGVAAVQRFLRALERERDFMTETRFGALLDTQGIDGSGTSGGGSLHAQVLGDTLEGLVLHCYQGKEKTTIKYKFPNYTVRTFGLRQALAFGSDNEGAFDNDNTGGMTSQLLGPRATTHFEDYASRWCASDAGRRYWLRFLSYCAMSDAGKIPE